MLTMFNNRGGEKRIFNILTTLTAFIFVVSSSFVVASCSSNDSSDVQSGVDGTRGDADSSVTDDVTQDFPIHNEYNENDVSY